MRTILLILMLASLYNIAGCVKATNDYNQFIDYHDSVGGTIVDFLIGYNSASQGDIGPALDLIGQDNDLKTTMDTKRMWAWIWTIPTLLLVFFVGRRSAG